LLSFPKFQPGRFGPEPYCTVSEAERLQVLEDEASATQVEAAVPLHGRGRGDPAVGVDRNDDVAPGRQALGEIGVPLVVGRDHIARRAGAGEGVLDVGVIRTSREKDAPSRRRVGSRIEESSLGKNGASTEP
jgi:hypothetical protein